MIKIVTVYNSLNPGSYLQAVALYEIINKEYGEVAFLYTKTRNLIFESLKKSIKLILKGKFKYAYKQFIMGVKFKKLLKKFVINKSKNIDDIYILGSDEIWNVARLEMSQYPIFWGEGLNQNRCICYAPSINYATKEQLENCVYVKNALKKIYSLSVRDEYSKNILKLIVNREIEEVCDPTLLIDIKYYQKMESPKKYDNYIFIYASPNKITIEARNEIIDYAKKNNKKLISYYMFHSWCDEVVYGGPSDFLSLVHNSDCVFTSTFHGTIFSLIYNKKFIVFGENRKVEKIIEKVKLNNFYKKNNIEKILSKNFGYDSINELIMQERDKGLNYLYHNISSLM